MTARRADNQNNAKQLQASTEGRAEHFTGSARVDPLFSANTPSHTSGGSVTFERGARTAWHSHPLGQTLIVTAGRGWIQQWGGQVEEIRQGDVVSIPPDVKHWHGAMANTSVTHIAIQESLNGKTVEWMEKVSDEQYRNSQSTPSDQINNWHICCYVFRRKARGDGLLPTIAV
ncbi:MAG: cupin domain-containing protein [Candidatus Sulfotelmatobacter sp.]